MQYEILNSPDFSMLRIVFDKPGEKLISEAQSMVGKDASVVMETGLQGGVLAAAKRRVLGGESLFQNTFTATAPDQELWLAPGPEGDIEVVECRSDQPVFLSSGAFLASSPRVMLDTTWQGGRGFFSGAGLFLLKAEGKGPLFFASYGGIHEVRIRKSSYICDTSHIVGFTAGLDYKVRKLGGIKSLFFSGEGLVCEFSGDGRLWIATRNPAGLASFLHPFRAIQRGG